MGLARTRPLLLAVGLLLTAGCASAGNDSSDSVTVPSTTERPRPTAASEPQIAAFPRDVRHAFGRTTIPEPPTRVASIGFTDHDTLLALGITPVLVREWFGERPAAAWPWAEDLVDGAPVVMQGEINYEQIAAVEPDIIVAAYAGLTEEEYSILSEIAPTVAQSADHDNYLAPWQATTIGEAVGKEAEIAGLIADAEMAVADVQNRYPELVGTRGVAVNTRDDGTYGVRGPMDARGRFLAAVGIQIPDEIAALVPPGEFVAPIRFERIDLIGEALDVVVWAPESDVDRALVESLGLYQGEDRLVFIGEEEAAALGFSSVLSLPWAVEHIVPRLAAAVDGDPRTTTGPPR
ncbi:MAG TPA: ABC transporter substrate-binding protein [Ilumatobacter sp.]|nr:ABC transporter substrate-binding protein [Ilumatobacter sp.]